jgi:PPP family 3-phenylpropionic acid transporter
MNLFQNDPMPSVSAGRRVAVYYFLQAMSVGAVNAFAGIWLAFKGIGPEQIGVIFAVPLGLILLIGVWVGRMADRAMDWRQVIVIGALASAVAPVGLFFDLEFMKVCADLLPAVEVFWGLFLY